MVVEIKSELATKEFDLSIKKSTGECYLTIVAYGDMWEEHFENTEDLKLYLLDTWNFQKDQLQELYGKASTY